MRKSPANGIIKDSIEDAPADAENAPGAGQQNGAVSVTDSSVSTDRIQVTFSKWSDEERELLTHLRAGETIVVNMSRGGHPNLVRWAKDAGLFVRIDRNTEWGNPFVMGRDGDRDTVVHNFEHYYLPHKPSLLEKLPDLRAKALGCWCAKKLCHGHILKERAE